VTAQCKFFASFVEKGFHGGNFNLNTGDVLKAAFVRNFGNFTPPTPSTLDPRWGAAGGTDYSQNQVVTGTSYTGPITLTNVTWLRSGALVRLDFDDIDVPRDAQSGFTSATHVIIYNDTIAGKYAVGYIDLGGTFSLRNGPIKVRLNVMGFAVAGFNLVDPSPTTVISCNPAVLQIQGLGANVTVIPDAPPSPLTSGSFEERAQDATFAYAGDADSPLGRDFNVDSGPYRAGTEFVCYQPNGYGVRPVYDSAKNAIKFTIPANNVDSSPSGALYLRFADMPLNGNGSRWTQFRVEVDPNYVNTIFRNGDGSEQQGLKIFTMGPAPYAGLPFGGTNVWMKLVLTAIYGYRFPAMYRKAQNWSDWSMFNLQYQTEFPTCAYTNDVRIGSPTVPRPNASAQCRSYVPNVKMTFLLHVKTGARIANPNWPSQQMPEVFEHCQFRLWMNIPGVDPVDSYTLIHNFHEGSSDLFGPYDGLFNAAEDVNGNWFPSGGFSQLCFETYMTPKYLTAQDAAAEGQPPSAAGLQPPGVDSFMYVSEVIVQDKPASLTPEQAIPVPIDYPSWAPVTSSTKTSIALNQLSAVDPCPSNTCSYYQPGPGGNERISGAYSFTGMVVARHHGRHGSLVFNSGGHASHFGNFIFVFDLYTRMWKPLGYTPYPADANTPIDGYGNWNGITGAMCSHHSFDNQVYLPPELGGGAEGSLIMCQIAAGGNATVQSPYSHRFDLATKAFSLYAAPSAGDSSNNTVTETPTMFDDTRNYLWRVWNTGAAVEYLDPLSTPSVSTPHGTVRRWVRVNVPGGTNFVQGNVGVYCKQLDSIIVMDAEGSATDGNVKIYALRLDNISAGWTVVTQSVPNGYSISKSKSIEWVPDLKKLAIYTGAPSTGWDQVASNQVIWLTPPLTWGGSWTWSTETFGGDPAAIDGTGNPAFIYKRMRWIPLYKNLVWAHGIFNNGVTLWRPAGI
jgi:hypothetical protein